MAPKIPEVTIAFVIMLPVNLVSVSVIHVKTFLINLTLFNFARPLAR